MGFLSVYDDSSVTLRGYDFRGGAGDLILDGDRILGTGVLIGKWFDDTSWALTIDNNDPGAMVTTIPEPSTLAMLLCGLLTLTCYWKRRRG